jgi:hypothetical protein
MTMITLQLEPHQAEMLNEILQSFLGDLRMEIAHTDSMDFREELKKREVLLKDLIGRLATSP